MSQQRNNDSIGLWWNAEKNRYDKSKPVEIAGLRFWVNVYQTDPKKLKENPNLPHINLYLRPAGPAPNQPNNNPPF